MVPTPRNISKDNNNLPKKQTTLSVYEKLKPITSSSAGCKGEDQETNDTLELSKKSPTEDDVLQMANMSLNSIKKFLGEEAEKYRAANLPQLRRERRVKKLLATQSFPEFVVRSKTTSAIFKEYQNFKEGNNLKPHRGCYKSSKKIRQTNKSHQFLRNKTLLPSIPTESILSDTIIN